MAKVYVGCSGWTFPGWKGTFYPKGLAAKKELAYAAQRLTSIEINGTFYSIQKPHTFQKWFDEVPEDFIFAIKGPQFITHVRRLKDFDAPLANFFASGILCLKQKLGPVLWQFPPNMTLKDDRFEKFMKALPHDAKAASQLAKAGYSEWMKERCFFEVTENFKIRHAFEFRHPSFMNPDFIKLMREYNVAVVFAHSGAEKSPYFEDVTSDFVYCRMHGQEEKFKKGYTKDILQWLGDRVELWMAGKQPKDAQTVLDSSPTPGKKDAFVYFDTEAKEYAPQDALAFSQIMGIKKMIEEAVEKPTKKSRRKIS